MNLKIFNTVNEFWGIVKELNTEAIENEARQRFNILVIGPDDVHNDLVASALKEGQPIFGEVVQTMNNSKNGTISSLPSADLYIYVLPSEQVGNIEHSHKISAIEYTGKPVLLGVAVSGERLSDEILGYASRSFAMLPMHRMLLLPAEDAVGVSQRLVPAVVESLPHLHLALGRTLPAFRDSVSSKLILETSRVNAEFALFSSLPANIPVLGGLFAAGADILVLTKNQIMLLFKLAAVYGKSHNSKTRTLAEIAPVVGGAFVWRTVARTLVGFLPGVVAAVPKTLVAFAGTFVVGQMAKHYYAFGRKPSRKLLEQFYEDALAEARSLLGSRRRAGYRESSRAPEI